MVFKDVNRNEHQLSPSAFIPQRHPDESHPVDITEAATDTIDYVVTDPAGLTSTSTRQVIIQPTASNFLRDFVIARSIGCDRGGRFTP